MVLLNAQSLLVTQKSTSSKRPNTAHHGNIPNTNPPLHHLMLYRYHSHFSAQYGDGVFGPIVIKGPTSANYDEDLGAITVNEWYAPSKLYKFAC
jgi:FtsP/CotA-like multicopper oxidase with cupredoxin domain